MNRTEPDIFERGHVNYFYFIQNNFNFETLR